MKKRVKLVTVATATLATIAATNMVSTSSFELLLTALNLFSRLWKLDKAEFHRALILLTCIIMLTASSMFQATMFYQNSTDANMFWMFLGYLIFMLKDNPEKADKKEQVKI